MERNQDTEYSTRDGHKGPGNSITLMWDIGLSTSQAATDFIFFPLMRTPPPQKDEPMKRVADEGSYNWQVEAEKEPRPCSLHLSLDLAVSHKPFRRAWLFYSTHRLCTQRGQMPKGRGDGVRLKDVALVMSPQKPHHTKE